MALIESLAETYFPQIVRRYEKIRGWEPGGKEWKHRKEIGSKLALDAIDLEQNNTSTKVIINMVGEELNKKNIGYSIGKYTHINPLKEHEGVLLEPICIFMKLPGRDKSKNVGGLIVWYEGMAHELHATASVNI